jgi:flagellar biosynthetic protein FlhB
MAEDWSEKTHPPTPHRRAEARRRGNIARSAELSAALLCLAALLLVQHSAPQVVATLRQLLSESLASPAPTAMPPARFLMIGKALAPIAVGLMLVALAANLVQTGFWVGLRRDARPLDPAAGLARIFSQRSVVGLLMAVLKLTFVAGVSVVALRGRIESLVTLADRPVLEAIAAGMTIVLAVAIRIVAALLVLSLLDYAYQRYVHERDLWMTRREVKEEARRQEGDPDRKRRRRDAAAAAWAATRPVRDVAAADVVLTAPDDRAAVALRFDPRSMTAPRVLLRSRSAVDARAIREAAIRHNIAVVERDDLATAIVRSVTPGRDVPGRFHPQLAEVLAYAHVLATEVG